MTRDQKIGRARELRAEGWTWKRIGDRFGVSNNTAKRWVDDGYRARQDAAAARALPAWLEKQRGVCEGCGGETMPQYGGPASNHRSSLCAPCRRTKRTAERHWTPGRVVATLREWAAALGRTPAAWMAKQEGAPVTLRIVEREFGCWSKGLEAAGLEANPVGGAAQRGAA